MGSNEAGERHAGKEETLLLPTRSHRQTHAGSNTLAGAQLQCKGAESHWRAHGSTFTM